MREETKRREVTNVRQSDTSILIEYDRGFERDGFSKSHFMLVMKDDRHGAIVRLEDAKVAVEW